MARSKGRSGSSTYGGPRLGVMRLGLGGNSGVESHHRAISAASRTCGPELWRQLAPPPAERVTSGYERVAEHTRSARKPSERWCPSSRVSARRARAHRPLASCQQVLTRGKRAARTAGACPQHSGRAGSQGTAASSAGSAMVLVRAWCDVIHTSDGDNYGGRRSAWITVDGSADRRPAAAWPGVGEPVPYLPSYLRWHRWRRRWWSVIRVTTCVTTLQRPERVNIRGVQSTGEIRLQRVLRSETPRKLAPNFLPPFSLFSLPFSSSCFAD